MTQTWTQTQEDSFRRDGFLVLRSFASGEEVRAIRQVAEDALSPVIGPAEFEVDVRYPGSPDSYEQEGGRTPRRLLHAIARSAMLRNWATQPRLGQILARLLHTEQAMLCQSHHNCIMTKYPRYSSSTLWHQDIRYWSFQRPDLISFWLALGHETKDNGALQLIPGSHRTAFQSHQLDELKFLRTDIPENQPWLQQSVGVDMDPGDLLLFHAGLFHAAGANHSQTIKLALVCTAHAFDNQAILGSRSDRLPSIPFRILP